MPNLHDLKKATKEAKHAEWLKNKKANGEMNQTSKIYDSKNKKRRKPPINPDI